MKAYSFEPGTRIRLGDKSYVIVELRGSSVVVCPFGSTFHRVMKQNELRTAYAKGQLQFLDLLEPIADGDVLPDPLAQQFSDFTPKQRAGALLKHHYLKALCPAGRVTVSRVDLAGEIAKVWEALPPDRRGDKPPSVSSFYGWRAQWRNGSYSLKRLVNRFDLRGRRPTPPHQMVVPILENAVSGYFASSARPTIAEVVRLANGVIDRQNKVRPPGDQIPHVTGRQMVQAVSNADRYEVLKRRYGVAHARTATRVFGKRNESLRPLQRIEVDHTPLDVLCLSDDLKKVRGRAYLTLLIDVATRMIVGIYITFRNPCSASVLRALKQAILPKDGLLKEFGIKGLWPVWGVPEVLVVDNGKEFHSNDLETAAQDLGISVIYCPPRQPFFKGTVERFLKELNYGFVHQLPGTTFAKYNLRHDYKSEEFAVLTLKELQRLVFRWVVEVYSRTFHRGIQTCPLEKWNELSSLAIQALPKRIEVLDVVLSHSVERTLTSKGIEINSLHYTCEELAALRYAGDVKKLSVRASNDDLGEIQVLNPKTGHYMTAQCTDPEYAVGLTLEQHKYLCTRAREDYAALPHEAAMRAAKLDIREELDALVAARTSAQSKHPTAKSSARKSKSQSKLSGNQQQAIAEFAVKHTEEPVAPPAGSADITWSFDNVQAFPTGQSSFF